MLRVSRALLPPVLQALQVPLAAGVRNITELALKPTPIKGGNGGRSSVSGGVATVFGCTGFVGRYVVNELARIGTQVVCPYRSSEEKAMTLKQMGDLGQVVLLREWSLGDDDYTREAISRSNIVINLVGATMETRNFSWEDVHTAWPAKLAAMTAEAGGVERFIHFSDVGASPTSASRRMRSKAAGDEAVRAALPGATIFRPAPVVGEEDDFFNNLLFQVKNSVVVPMIDGGDQVVAPHNVLDTSTAVLQALSTPESVGKTYYLGGPEELTMRQVVDLIQSTVREDEDHTMMVPRAIAKLMAAPTDWVSRVLPPLPSRNYMSGSDWIEEICEGKTVPKGVLTYADLDMVPHKVTEGLAIEAFRYYRVGGYEMGDTSQLARQLPSNVKRYFGMREPERPI